jgi:hypothetical protein
MGRCEFRRKTASLSSTAIVVWARLLTEIARGSTVRLVVRNPYNSTYVEQEL